MNPFAIRHGSRPTLLNEPCRRTSLRAGGGSLLSICDECVGTQSRGSMCRVHLARYFSPDEGLTPRNAERRSAEWPNPGNNWPPVDPRTRRILFPLTAQPGKVDCGAEGENFYRIVKGAK